MYLGHDNTKLIYNLFTRRNVSANSLRRCTKQKNNIIKLF